MIELRALAAEDIEAHIAGEDDEVVRWLSGAPATEESTRRHFAALARNAAVGVGKRGFGVWLDGRLAGYVDFDPEHDESSAAGDVNLAYSVHPWARRRSVATCAVRLVCEHLVAEGIGERAIIRVERENAGSVAVARRSGFDFLGEEWSNTERDAAGEPVVFAVYGRRLRSHRG